MSVFTLFNVRICALTWLDRHAAATSHALFIALSWTACYRREISCGKQKPDAGEEGAQRWPPSIDSGPGQVKTRLPEMEAVFISPFVHMPVLRSLACRFSGRIWFI
jgi:hypothetical protein